MSALAIDVKDLEQFLKNVQHGPQALKALKLRTASHWIDPSLDRLSSRMLPAYDRLCEMVHKPFHILDVGCMCGYLWHHMKKRLGNTFRYVGVDDWDEALVIARDFQPEIEVHKCNVLTDELPKMDGGWDYVWCSNIHFANPEEIIEKLIPVGKTILIAQPPWCGDYETPASKYGAETFDCGETKMVKINGAFHIQ